MPKPGSKCVMVLPDLHLPHHNPEALSVVLRTYDAIKPDEIVILGDWLDCEAFTSHPRKSLTENDAQDFYNSEILPLFRILNHFNRSKIVYIEGNHEHRVERWAISSSSNRSVYSMISPGKLVTDRFENVDWVPYVAQGIPHYRIAPDLWAVHGWSISRHAAAAHLGKASTFSIVYGHTHRMQCDTRACADTGKLAKAWSPGCLSIRQPLWRHNNPTDWAHGFSLVYVSERSGRWSDYTITIDRGSCILPDGREIKS